MFGSSKNQLNVLVLRDTDAVVAAVRQALTEADDAERPGLERALALAEQAAAVPDDEVRARWAHRRLAAVGYQGALDSVSAVKALRQAEPDLSLRAAVELTRAAAAHPPVA
ncbi:hypothetical protein [Streptomyces poonensis]|uniref:Uncharacterized protein n=1 Tax=Streptomyces poonensis TaxID=68255 RepID=A0A918UDH8_9ACTN|nr:hypothetical protein [Streptomyces poonensis]GGY92306.1 hypothetical protein GCM10010365_08490 [Streptomyces poonensis]GLJ87713.1 hypothetical protein GCM10017589_03130 [Streptomyces poonensis]